MPTELAAERVKAALVEGFKDGCATCGSRRVVVPTDEPLYEGVAFDVTCQDCGFKQEMTIIPPKKH